MNNRFIPPLVGIIIVVFLFWFWYGRIEQNSSTEYESISESIEDSSIDEEPESTDKKQTSTVEAERKEIAYSFFYEERQDDVLNQDDVVKKIEESEEKYGKIGIPDFSKNYKLYKEDHYDFGASYRFIQFYKGYEVFLSEICVSVDSDNKISFMSGTYVDINNFIPDFSHKEYVFSDATEFGRLIKTKDDEFINSVDEIIYTKENVVCSVYRCDCNMGGTYYIDASTGDILAYDSHILT